MQLTNSIYFNSTEPNQSCGFYKKTNRNRTEI